MYDRGWFFRQIRGSPERENTTTRRKIDREGIGRSREKQMKKGKSITPTHLASSRNQCAPRKKRGWQPDHS